MRSGLVRRSAHAVLAIAGSAPWLIAYWAGAVAMLFAIVADRVHPDADRGNCWGYALPRWRKHGGMLGLAFVEDSRFMLRFPVIHCVWFPEFPRRASYEMTAPIGRKKTMMVPWFTFYFPFKVVRYKRETKPTDTAPAPLEDV